jgi:hypothetical protein
MLGVKYSCVLFSEIGHVWTQHLEQANDIRAKAGRRVFIHGRPNRMQTRRIRWLAPGKNSDLDYLWPDLGWVYGSSGFCAALWARHGMGYDEVILCGVPLDPGGYAPAVTAFKKPQGERGTSFADHETINRWRGVIAEFTAQGKTAGIRSMSGWTRDALGAPA